MSSEHTPPSTLHSHWRDTLVPSESCVQDIIKKLNETALQIAIVVAPDHTLLGTITDGDVRRGLLRGMSLDSSIEPIIHREPLVVPSGMNRDMLLHLMQANVINAIPVVNEQRRVVGMHVLNELLAPVPHDNMMIIMAGGQGTRLHPHTETCPKPLLPVGGKPILEHILERAREEGFGHFVITTHYLGHKIEEYFGDGSRWHVHIEYLQEESPLGTAGAIGLLRERPVSSILVSNGDVLTDIRYGELLDFHTRHNAVATMAVRLHEWQHPFGVVHIKGIDLVGFEEKPVARSYINAGIYALEPEVLDHICPDERCDMPALFARLREVSARTIVYPMHEPWLDVGRSSDLEQARSAHADESAI